MLAVALLALWLIAAALLWAWAAQPQAGGLRMGVSALAASGAAAGLLHGWLGLGEGRLTWDGAQWLWHARGAKDAGVPVSLSVRADGGGWIWIRACPAGAGGWWLLPCRGQSPDAWGELRRAVYFPARPSDRPQ